MNHLQIVLYTAYFKESSQLQSKLERPSQALSYLPQETCPIIWLSILGLSSAGRQAKVLRSQSD